MYDLRQSTWPTFQFLLFPNIVIWSALLTWSDCCVKQKYMWKCFVNYYMLNKQKVSRPSYTKAFQSWLPERDMDMLKYWSISLPPTSSREPRHPSSRLPHKHNRLCAMWCGRVWKSCSTAPYCVSRNYSWPTAPFIGWLRGPPSTLSSDEPVPRGAWHCSPRVKGQDLTRTPRTGSPRLSDTGENMAKVQGSFWMDSRTSSGFQSRASNTPSEENFSFI